MTANAAAASTDFDLGDLIDGAALLASTANAVMQLALPAVGYGVLVPGKVRRDVSEAERAEIERNAATYLGLAQLHRRSGA